MNIPTDLKYTDEHEWLRIEGGTAIVGITDYAQGELGDVVFVELPGVGDPVKAGSECGTIEAVKTVAQIFAPVSGKITEVNGELENDASLINRDPYGDGWMFKIAMADAGEADGLLSADEYREKVS
jgi:glycine cleavage system H protein